MKKNQTNFTVAGTNIEEVKRLNANSGMSYNELNEWFAKQMKEKSINSESEFAIEISFNGEKKGNNEK